jgi:hypothetical protein
MKCVGEKRFEEEEKPLKGCQLILVIFGDILGVGKRNRTKNDCSISDLFLFQPTLKYSHQPIEAVNPRKPADIHEVPINFDDVYPPFNFHSL